MGLFVLCEIKLFIDMEAEGFLLNISLVSSDYFIALFSSASCAYITTIVNVVQCLYLFFILFQPLHLYISCVN